MTPTILDETADSIVTDPDIKIPVVAKRPPPHKHEKRLSQRDRDTLEAARQGKRDPETMAGWTFRFGLHGLSGRRAVQVKTWGEDTWFWVEWATSKTEAAKIAKTAMESASTGFDRL